MASKVLTAISGLSIAKQSPLAVLTAMRSPVYEPGPFATATASRLAAAILQLSKTCLISGVNKPDDDFSVYIVALAKIVLCSCTATEHTLLEVSIDNIGMLFIEINNLNLSL
jgi:archaellum biogenesis protein FlaJ (TadC family)